MASIIWQTIGWISVPFHSIVVHSPKWSHLVDQAVARIRWYCSLWSPLDAWWEPWKELQNNREKGRVSLFFLHREICFQIQPLISGLVSKSSTFWASTTAVQAIIVKQVLAHNQVEGNLNFEVGKKWQDGQRKSKSTHSSENCFYLSVSYVCGSISNSIQ